ncbi:MAG: hypothetical protein IJI56_02810 [Firmicutes bacterium]|nr:hypothetical protein [Bacillota bacterium]
MGNIDIRQLLLDSCRTGTWVVAICEILILLLLYRKYEDKKKTMILCMALITLGLVVDALVISNGIILGSYMELLTRIRFVAHGVLIPLILPICGYALNAREGFMRFLWILTLLVMAAGAAEGFATKFELVRIAGVTRMVASEETPQWANYITMGLSFGMVIPMLLCGLVAWIKQKNGNLFFAAFFMFLFSALGPATGNTDLIFYVSMFGEVLMVLFMYLYASKKYRKH